MIPNKTKLKVLAGVLRLEDFTVADLCLHTGLTASMVYRELANLQNEGILTSSSAVEQSKPTPRHRPRKRYQLSSDPAKRDELRRELVSFLPEQFEEPVTNRHFENAQPLLIKLALEVLTARPSSMTQARFEAWEKIRLNEFEKVEDELKRAAWESEVDFSETSAAEHPIAVATRLYRHLRGKFEELRKETRVAVKPYTPARPSAPTRSPYLPPGELWPTRIYTLPEFQTYAERFNPTEELLGKTVAAGRGDRTAALFEDQKLTYNQLLTQANKFGNSLRELGVEEGDRVILRAPNIPPALVANFAVLKLGAVCVPTSPLFSRTEIAHVANDSEAVAIVVSAMLLSEVEAATENFKTVRDIVVIGGDVAELKAKGFRPYAELVLAGSAELDPVLRERQHVGLLLYTSGTTGRPKGTVHFVEELLIVPDSFGKYCWRVTENDVIGGSAPLAFGAGYSSYATIPFRFGAAASLIAKFEPEKMFETIQKHRISILTLAPTAYRKMLQVPDAKKKYDLSSLRVCTGGGESLTAPTYHAWKERFGLDIYEGLGTTEMMYVFASSVVSRRAKPGSFGQAVPGYELRVVDEDGKQVPPGNIGHFVARGPTGTIYWRDPEKQRHAITKDGWNRVGDFVYVDDDGYFWFVSREDDIIKSSAYRIGPEEIEVELATHPAVLDVGVIGVPDEIRGQIAKAFVVLKPGASATPEELIEFCRGKIATYKLPREIVIVSELPRTPTGKLLRRVLRQTASRDSFKTA